GAVEVSVTFTDSAIVAIEVTAHKETAHVGDVAFEPMIADMLAANGTGVDSISGATFSSAALRGAVNDAAEQAAITDTLNHYGLPHDAEAVETYHRVNRQLWDSLARGEINRNKLFAVRFSRVLQALGQPDAGNGREMNDYYENELSNHADLIPGALNALEELGEVATLAIVSNGAQAVQQPRLSASGLERFMDGIYISEKVGAAKPSAKIFDYSLRDLGLTNRSRVLVVGDDLLADIKGGINAGLDTCWVNFSNEENDTGIQPKYTIQSYEELYKIVMEPEELENVGMRNLRHRNEG
ncbi:MAG: YjjG family noncanonical pyrimidine nucleotidase, partial [Gemmiger formicilis]|uniref:YjjG family noncanonical pyrimidine nucleotidase n=1 Tax=Gemmiger formicilis TaxID=745368 RepID=UPI003FED8059|nr:YjjG family noncanonical pyrimidine nucleotidase [Gemmiger formicilis]